MIHIFNISAIVNRVAKNKKEKNLYEKINQILKGAKINSPALLDEIISIVEEETKEKIDELKALKSNLEASKAAAV